VNVFCFFHLLVLWAKVLDPLTTSSKFLATFQQILNQRQNLRVDTHIEFLVNKIFILVLIYKH
jgi:hypothetical protein